MKQLQRSRWIVGLLGASMLLVSACSSSSGGGPTTSRDDFQAAEIPNCLSVPAAVSPEKVELFRQLSNSFRDSQASKDLGCVNIVPTDVSSGDAARLLVSDWPQDQTTKPRPILWSPAASTWVEQVNQAKGANFAPDAKSFARTPLVFAMPKVMAEKLGYPGTPIGYKELHDLVINPDGWGAYGAALWGPFRLGKTNPEKSTSGLNELLAQTYAAVGKTDGLTVDDVAASETFSKELEGAAIHYGSTTMAFLNNLAERDRRSQGLDYASAVAVEEKSVIDYNRGNPDGIVSDGENIQPPHDPLVAVYPKEGTLFSDNPLAVLSGASWATPEQVKGAQAFLQYALQPENQKLVMDYGFRPADPSAPLGGLITRDNGVDPAQPSVTLATPSPDVARAAIQQWNAIRKPGKVLMLVDVSGSMSEDAGDGRTKMEAAIAGAQDSLARLRSEDQLGIRLFSTGDQFGNDCGCYDLRAVSPLGDQSEQIKSQLNQLRPVQGTPLFRAVIQSYKDMQAVAEAGSVNAIVVLTDGQNDDGTSKSLGEVLAAIQQPAETTATAPVRIFTIGYGQGADVDGLTQMATATGGRYFDARDPKKIQQVLDDVMSNF